MDSENRSAASGGRPSVLVVADFTGNLGKVDRHVGTLTPVADVTMVSVTAPDDAGEIRFETAPSVGFRPVDLLLMFALALVEAVRGEYDAVASFSLVPHGCFALAVGRVTGTPVHLGIIGADVDVHAQSWYAPVVVRLMRAFDVITVPGTAYRTELHRLGVPPERTAVLVNPIPVDDYRPPVPDAERRYDYLWIGRLSPEKNPVGYVETLAELAERGREFDAVLVGDGALRWAVEAAVARNDLGDSVDVVGWIDDPADYYRDSRTFVLTSRRDALPLTLLEAMATGVVPVVPDVGNVRDVADDGRNALVVRDAAPATLADALERLDDDPGLYRRLAAAAPDVGASVSYEAAADDWRDALGRMGVAVPAAAGPE